MYTPTYDSVNKIWSGPKRVSIYNANANLGYLILNAIKTSPDRIFQVCDDTKVEMTCKEMFKRTLKISTFFNKIGLKQDDVIGFVAENSENLTSVIVACLYLGLPVNPLAPVMNENDIIYMFSLTKPKVIFCEASLIEKVKNSVEKLESDCEIITFLKRVEGYQFIDDIIESIESIDQSYLVNLDISSTPAFIMCSSGTTSRAKGISKSHEQCITQLYPTHFDAYTYKGVCFYSTGPYWLTWILYLIFNGLYGYKRIITTEKVTPELFMDIIERHGVTTTICPPYVGAKLLKSNQCREMKNVKSVVIGGAIVSEEFSQKILTIFPNSKFWFCYGSTELDFVTATLNKTKGTSSGLPIYNYSIKIVDEFNKPLDAFKQGEIIVKPSVPFMNYYGEPEKYSETIDSDGWVRSGDVGYFDYEGYLYVTDRVKNQLKHEGINYSAREIEDIINQIPGVIQSAVVGIIGEDDGYDITYAFVIKQLDFDSLTEEDIVDFVSNKVIKQKRISGGVHFVTEFPFTATGKLSTGSLKEIAKNLYKRKQKD